MKRQGDTVLNQPAAKKSDNVSTDLRSKIGAKLSTLLNRISSANAERSKRQLYEDLFRDSTHSPIIIDPNVVVKIEEDSDSDGCTEDSKLPAENFLISAKSRLTELLHKQQDSEKENSLSASGSSVTSSVKSKTLQSISCNALNNRTKSSSSELSNSSNPDIFISQKQPKNVCVLVEDIVKSGSINSFHSLLNKQTKNSICSLSAQTSENSKNVLNSQKQCTNTKDLINNDITSDRKSCQSKNQFLDKVTRPSTSDSSFSNLDNRSTTKISSQSDVPKPFTMSRHNAEVLKYGCNLSNNVLDLGDILVDKDEAKLQAYADNSEYVDDPCLNETSTSEEKESESNFIVPEIIQNQESPDADVVLLCEKQPTYEVITLEDDDVADIHKCSKCGKTFRAESLLNFHLRMHGSNSNESLSVPS